MKASEAAALAGPSIGPSVVILFGQQIPVLAWCLSIVGLLLARYIAPPPLRKLTRKQHYALTLLLVIVCSLIVVGAFGGKPLEPGMATIWGMGLGFSGLLAVEMFAERVRALLRAALGLEKGDPNDHTDPQPPQGHL